MKKLLLLILSILFFTPIYSRQLWLSPTGSDLNKGLTLETAWKTPNYAFNNLVAGDTLWVKGGTYTVTATVKSKNAGTKTQPVKVFAVRGEKPLFDCSSMRNYGNESSTYRGMDLRQAWWHVRGIKIYKAGYNGIINYRRRKYHCRGNDSSGMRVRWNFDGCRCGKCTHY